MIRINDDQDSEEEPLVKKNGFFYEKIWIQKLKLIISIIYICEPFLP